MTESRGRDRMIAPMACLSARVALLLDVGNLSIGRDFPIMPGHAPAAERREPQETDKTTHGDPRTDAEQILYRSHTRNNKLVGLEPTL